MINNTINILDNTGCFFSYENGQFVVKNNIPGFLTLKSADQDKVLSYLCKNKDGYEAGVGKVVFNNDKLVVERIKVVASSNNNEPVEFSNGGENYLYSFANSYNFNTAFNNLIFKNANFTISNIRATYYVDLVDNLEAVLPEASSNQNLVVEFKTTNSDHLLKVKDSNDELVLVLGANSYSKLICTGSEWVELKDQNGSSSQSLAAPLFSSLGLSSVGGNSGSLQYNNNGSFDGSNVYVGNDNKVLLGSDEEGSANIVLPTSGLFNTVFNNSRNNVDFIVKGNSDKNLYFGYEGRLGLNMPSGARPQTSLHIINNSCQEGIRLENRNQCYPSNLTLYHKPSATIDAGSVVGTINLSAKNSNNNQVQYVQLRSKALSFASNFTKGEFAVAIENNGAQIEQLRVNSSGVYVTNSLYASNLKLSTPTTSGNLLISDNNGNLVLTNVNNSPIIDLLDDGVVVFTGVCT